MQNKLKKIIANVLQINEKNIDENTSMDTVESWDSLNQMKIVISIEEQFRIEFDEDEIVTLNSYASILKHLKCN